MTAILLALTQILIVGLPAAILLDRSSSRRRTLGLAFLLGSGIVSLVLLLLPQWSIASATVTLLVIASVLWIRCRPRFGAPQRPSPFDLATAFLVAAHGAAAVIGPVVEWDFWAIWGLKARIFFERKAIDWAFLEEPLNAFAHPDYPQLLPLNYVFTALHGGGWDDRSLGIITTCFGAALLLIVRELFERELSRHVAALATFATASIALSPWIGIAEAPMIAYGGAGLLLIRSGAVRSGAVLLGFAAFTKNEGLALAVAAAIGLLLAQRRRDVVRLWPALAIAAPWLILRAMHALPTDLAGGDVWARISTARVGEVMSALRAPAQPLLWLAIGAALLIYGGQLLRHERFLSSTVFVQFIFYVGAYVVTPKDVRWHVAASWPRLVQHIAFPLAFLALVLAGRPLSDRAYEGERQSDKDGEHDDRNDERDDGGHRGDAQRDDHGDLHDEEDGNDRKENQFQGQQSHLEDQLDRPHRQERDAEGEGAHRQNGKESEQLEH
jgi:hypothetical protein